MHCKLICQRVFGIVGDRKEGRDLNEKCYELITDASSPVRKSVPYECGVSGSIKTDCQFPRNDLVVLLDIVLHYFISRIK
jgi:hypothetical protein